MLYIYETRLNAGRMRRIHNAVDIKTMSVVANESTEVLTLVYLLLLV